MVGNFRHRLARSICYREMWDHMLQKEKQKNLDQLATTPVHDGSIIMDSNQQALQDIQQVSLVCYEQGFWGRNH